MHWVIIDALDILSAQLMRDLCAIANFLYSNWYTCVVRLESVW